MTELIKGACIIMLAVCVGVMVFSIVNAIITSKRNTATDEATRRIFMAKLQKDGLAPSEETPKTSPYLKQPLAVAEPEKPKELNYDEYDNDVDINEDTGKNLKDFFHA